MQMKKSKLSMILGVLLVGGLFLLPMWNITLEAPQYPTPLGMDIYITRLADTNPNDIQNINLMNHYVGMKEIPEHIPEFAFFPWVVGVMVFLGLLFGFLGWHKMYLVWFILMAMLGVLGLYDFYLWEYDYGHSLSPTAALKFTNPDGTPMAYQPPLIGSKPIMNFTAHSYPRIGAYLMFLGMLLSLFAYFLGKKESKT